MRFRPFVPCFRLLAVATLSGFVLFGSSAGASTQAAKPKPGGTLNIVFSAEPGSADPTQMREVPNISPALMAMAIFDQLAYTDPTTLKIKPQIASSLATPDKGLTWVLKIRSGVRFSDGTAFDAEAVKYNWQRIADPVNRAAFASVMANVAAMDVTDPLTLRVTLKKADPYFDHVVARNLSTIGSPTALKANAAAFATKPVGAGPYLLKEWVRTVSQSYVKNPDYWQKGKPYFDAIESKSINDDVARLNTLTTGGAQVALDGAYENLKQYQASGKYLTLNTAATGGGYAFGFNMSKPPFNDIRLRQAIALTVDSKELIERANFGDASYVIVQIDEKSSPWYDKKLQVTKDNVVEAQKLVDAIVAERGGKPIEINYLALNSQNHVRMANAFQAVVTTKLKNVNVKLEVLAPQAGVPRQATGDYEMAFQGPRWWEPAVDMPNFFRTGSGQNYMRWSNPTVDAALDEMLATTDDKVKTKAHHTIIEQALKDVPFVWIARQYSFYAVEKAAVKNWQQIFELRPFVQDAWLAKPTG